ncbi:hypothetical protein [Streptomyces sp. NPDC055287]
MADKTAQAEELWPQILQAVKNRRRFTWILLTQNMQVLSYDGVTLTLSATNQGACDNLVGSGSPAVLEEALAEVLNTRPAIQLVVEGQAPFALPRSPQEGTATEVHVSVAVTTSEASGQFATSTPPLHLVLAQTAFLMHEQGNSQAAALLADVEDVELAPDSRFGDLQDAVLIMPPYLVPRFTAEVTAAIQPVFGHVASRHGLRSAASLPRPRFPISVTTGGRYSRRG